MSTKQTIPRSGLIGVGEKERERVSVCDGFRSGWTPRTGGTKKVSAINDVSYRQARERRALLNRTTSIKEIAIIISSYRDRRVTFAVVVLSS